jgi:hypothetical protein
MTILLLCIPAALLAGVLWGVAIEKHRAARRRGGVIEAIAVDNDTEPGVAYWKRR